MWSWAVRAAVLMTALTVAESSLAEEPTDAGATEATANASRRSRGVLPPRAIDAGAAYPAGATGDASVVLELTVGTDGTASDVIVVQGAEPFASAARAAALTWRFEPALRDGIPVKARIRFEARFTGERRTPPEPAPAGTSSEEPDQAPAPNATDTVAPGSPAGKEYAVTVQGHRAAPGGVSVSRAEVRTLPGAFGDPFRAVESLPGVTPVVSAVPLFFIRGAPPGNIGYFIDGVRVPLLFHALLGPAVIQPSFIDRIDVYRGAAPVRYGRFAGGVVAASTARPPDEVHGEAGLRLLDVGGTIGVPFADGAGHVMAGGRYSYTGLILSSLTNAVLEYWDYQLLADYELGRNDKIGVFAFGAFDYLGQDNAQSFAGTQFHRVDLRYDHRFGANTAARAAFTVGYDRSLATTWNDIQPAGGATPDTQGQAVSDRSLAGRLEVEHRMGNSVLRLGGDASLDDYGLVVSDPTLSFRDAQTLFRSRNDLMAGAYVDLEWHPDRRVTVTPGVRADVYRSQGRMEYGVDPRIGADFQVSKAVKLTHSLGLSHQAPNYLPNLPGAQIGGLRGGLQTALQASSGVETKLGGDVTASVTLFDQIFFNLSDPLGFSRSIAANVDVVDVRALGASYGVEFMVQRSLTRRLGGLLSYTLSRTERSRDDINSVSAFDHTHVGSLALGYDLGKKWRVGARAAYTSGVPTRTLTVSGPSFGGERGPPFFRLDLRIEKRFRLGQHGYWGVTAEVVNATAGTEVTTRSCSALRCTTGAVGPLVLPNIGVEAGF